MINGSPEDMATATHVVQQALTPVFLLSGIAALLNVFASRLARVADQADVLSRDARCASRDQQVRSLKLRSRALDASVVLAALAAILTCAAVLVLFFGGVRGSTGAEPLFLAFGGAMILTIGSITTFVVEMLLAARGVRSAIDRNVGADPWRLTAGYEPEEPSGTSATKGSRCGNVLADAPPLLNASRLTSGRYSNERQRRYSNETLYRDGSP